MTDVIAISAATAAYATEPLKASARVSGAGLSQETMQSMSLEARKADAKHQKAMMNIVGPAALALFFLDAGQQQKSLPQATIREAEDAYRDNHQNEAESDEEDDGDESPQEDDDEMFSEPVVEILALPSPDDFA
jgi:hypothetical protein